MKYIALFILLYIPSFTFAGTGETLQVQSFYAGIGALLILILFYDKIKKGIKLTWMRFFRWISIKKNQIFAHFNSEKRKNEFVLLRFYSFLID